ncbi:MAG: hypothetical protein EZS28_030433 [Streblomastix strix]|uniref:Uncharacterized protein n=1 Tax=Streblomastix strix TaxID=222440 RepID=A0A5J4UW10_9EUKA|nr:MAG: hypothetical protein EZS28_030433 [Streblomastix strix]
MQNPPTFGLQQTQQSNLLTPPAPSSIGHPAFLSSFLNQNLEQPSQQPTIRPPTLVQQPQNHAQEPRRINERLLDSPGKASKRKITQDLLAIMEQKIPGHKQVTHQDTLGQDLVENIIQDLENVSQTSVLLFGDMLDMNIQQLTNGNHSGEKQIQTNTQILYEWNQMKTITITITMIIFMIMTIIMDITKSEMKGMSNWT